MEFFTYGPRAEELPSDVKPIEVIEDVTKSDTKDKVWESFETSKSDEVEINDFDDLAIDKVATAIYTDDHAYITSTLINIDNICIIKRGGKLIIEKLSNRSPFVRFILAVWHFFVNKKSAKCS